MTVLRDVSQEMMKKFDEGAKQMIAGFASMAAGAKVLGMLSSTFGSSITTAADFEQAMARVGAVSGATGEDFEKLSRQARDLGRDTQYSATQAANSQELLARAGFQTNEIISAMPHLLYMAGAEGMDLARAADIAAGTLRGFNLEASEMSRVANVLAKTSSSTNTSIDTLGESFKYVAPDAKALKVSIEEVAAIVGVMGDANIKASQAGVYLRGAFNKLVSPTNETKEALQKLGITIQNEFGELKSFDTLMQEFSEKMQGMTGFKKKELFGEIFDARSSTGMLAVLTAFETGKLSRTIDDLYHVGEVAKEMYDRMSATAQGAQKRLESASEGMRIAIGNHLLPVYTKAIDLMARFKSWLTQLIEEHPIISKAVIGFTTALLGLSGATLLVVGGLASISGFMKMWPLLKVMAVSALTNIRLQARMALASFSKLIIPIVGLVALAGVIYYAWRKNLWGIRDMVTAVTEGFKMAFSVSVDGIADVDEELANKLKAAGIWDFAVTMGQVFFRVRQFWNGLVEGFQEGLDFLKEGFEWFKDIFSPVVESGQELLKFLGILKPAAKTQISTWKAWGQLIGRIAVGVLSLIVAFKGIKAVTSIFGMLGKAIGLIANPVGLTIVAILALVAAGVYVYNHWEEISEWFAGLWDDIAGYAQAAADWVKEKWQAVEDWWNSWTIDDVFAAVRGYISRAGAYVKGKIDDLKAWWNSWTIKDVFAPLVTWVSNTKEKVKQKWQEFSKWWDSWTLGDVWQNVKDSLKSAVEDMKQEWEKFKDWLLEKFSKLNPFNWELPSWLGGGKAGDNQVRNAETALNSWGIPDMTPTRILTPTEPVNVPTNLLPPPMPKPQPMTVTPEWTKGIQDLNALMGLNLDVPSVNLPAPVVNASPVNLSVPNPVVNVQTVNPVISVPPAVQLAPVVNVAPTNISQNTPILQSPTASVTQIDTTGISNSLADIEGLLSNVVGRDIEVRPSITPNPAPSSPLLIQHTQNQAAMAGQATVQAQANAPEKPVKVENQVDVKIESKPAQVILDGEKIGSFSFRWIERQNIRNGASAF